MKHIKVRLLSLFFGVLFFLQTNTIFSQRLDYNLAKVAEKDTEGTHSLRNYVLEPHDATSPLRIAAHRSHSSHSSHKSHSSHSSHRSSTTAVSVPTYKAPSTTTYKAPSTTTYEAPSTATNIVPKSPPSSYADPVTTVKGPSIVPQDELSQTTTGIPDDRTSPFSVQTRLVLRQIGYDRKNVVANSAWGLLKMKLNPNFVIIPQKEYDSFLEIGFSKAEATKKALADFYVTGSIIWTGRIYVASFEIGNHSGNYIRINKAHESLEMVITSLMNIIELQSALL